MCGSASVTDNPVEAGSAIDVVSRSRTDAVPQEVIRKFINLNYNPYDSGENR